MVCGIVIAKADALEKARPIGHFLVGKFSLTFFKNGHIFQESNDIKEVIALDGFDQAYFTQLRMGILTTLDQSHGGRVVVFKPAI